MASRIFAAAAVSTLLDIGAETGASDRQDALVKALRQGAQDTISQSGQQIVRRSLNVQPTLTVRPGWPLRVLVAKDTHQPRDDDRFKRLPNRPLAGTNILS